MEEESKMKFGIQREANLILYLEFQELAQKLNFHLLSIIHSYYTVRNCLIPVYRAGRRNKFEDIF